tara:strand:- start:1428 stop:2006 length:579 start_codon:yes stop_codon:yes gene_type:complete
MKALDIINKVKDLVGVELQEEVKLAQATLENGTVIEAENFSEGNEVFIVTEDEKVPMPVGEYTLEDGEILMIKEEGVIDSVGAKEEEEKEEASEELTEEPKEDVEEQNLEEDKEEMKYATKTELEEVKKLVEEVKEMVKGMEDKKEEMSAVQEPPQKVTHSPENEVKKERTLLESRRNETTYDRVLRRINNL